MRDIDKEIEQLLALKKEIINVKDFQAHCRNVVIVSQAKYNFWAEKNLLKSDKFYCIAPIEIKPYIEDFQG